MRLLPTWHSWLWVAARPEILLAVVETVTHLDEPASGLGTFTIIGSAAFNLLIITAVCVVSVPTPEVKKVRELGVFALDSHLVYICLHLDVGGCARFHRQEKSNPGRPGWHCASFQYWCCQPTAQIMAGGAINWLDLLLMWWNKAKWWVLTVKMGISSVSPVTHRCTELSQFQENLTTRSKAEWLIYRIC